MSKAMFLVLALSVGLLACERGRGEPPASQAKDHLTAAASTPAQAPDRPGPAGDPVPPTYAAELTPEVWLDLVLDERLLKATPDDASALFVQAGKLTRHSVTPESLELRAETSRHALQIIYAKSDAWLFQGLVLELVPGGAEALEALYKSVDEPLKRKLGKPLEVHAAGNRPPQKVYKLGKTHVAIINERPSQGRHVVYVEIAEPQQSD